MFDQMTQKLAHWADHVRPGDIVLFRFPVPFPQTRDGKPGIRPCLVVEVDDHGEERRLVLAYSTTATTRSNGGYDIAVTHVADLQMAGLRRATRFIGTRLLFVSPHHSGFDVGGSSAPVVGHLTGSRLERMQAVRARLHAEHDIAADRRRERSETPVTVERRPLPKVTAEFPTAA
ncbi:hypothetical protein GCM10011360_16570 [Primorskyibacter flagellatus]|uniref:Type II toxin-antitoxin system PemK/MazF family toxin n=1 Tax=Primorskyibacter flagellatus TaxID=1387277 RepID=A0A917A6Z4_9RHOB|nr:hypothetical protein [Primorskyibacter flagellatus]GGE29153.1 hypothetical protein GCM10011360_16570 [Primorskyibacter flagellatus]